MGAKQKRKFLSTQRERGTWDGRGRKGNFWTREWMSLSLSLCIFVKELCMVVLTLNWHPCSNLGLFDRKRKFLSTQSKKAHGRDKRNFWTQEWRILCTTLHYRHRLGGHADRWIMSHVAIGSAWLERRIVGACDVASGREERGEEKGQETPPGWGHAWAVRDERAGGDRSRLEPVRRFGPFSYSIQLTKHTNMKPQEQTSYIHVGL